MAMHQRDALARSAGDEVDWASLTVLLEFVATLVLGIVRVLKPRRAMWN